MPEDQLRVRWDRPVESPIDVLIAGATDSPRFRDARLPMVESLVLQRAACAGIPALLSSAVEIFPHQIRAALAVLSDPVQRYLLADEVGLGKTISTGFVIRQMMLDNPRARIAVLAPDALRRQWRSELREKFFIDDFSRARLKITAHETPSRWTDYNGFDLVVVDEAHRLVQVDEPEQSPYRELRRLAYSVPRLLLLSATPVTSRQTTHLALLHLLDPDLYKWEDRAAFQRRFAVRKRLATSVYGLDSEFEPVLPGAIQELGELIPGDHHFHELAGTVLACLNDQGDLREDVPRPTLAARVEALRAHVSETYRLHRRMIRHRRAQVTLYDEESDALPYEVRGRSSAHQLLLASAQHQAAQDALLLWQSRIATWLRDQHQLDEMRFYGQALAVLVSRANGPTTDLMDALRWRLHNDGAAALRAGLTTEEQALLSAPKVLSAEIEAFEMLAESHQDSAGGALLDALLPIFAKHHRVVVFCGPGSLAGCLIDGLRSTSSQLTIAEHTIRTEPSAWESDLVAWKAQGGVLIADDTAEDGLNLQDADAVVHCRLPWSPNRLEQRLGRVDRYAGAALTSRIVPAAQFVLASVEGEYSFSGAWLALLSEGFNIFTESVSTLQDAIDSGGADIWSAAMDTGPQGLVGSAQATRNDLARERREIDEMDMLESVHESSSGLRDVTMSIDALEKSWRGLEPALVGYAGDGPAGLRFAVRRTGPQSHQVTQFERGPADPLMTPRLLARAGIAFTPSLMKGVFNRRVALSKPGTRLFRSGNPFVDMLDNVISIDDRGQASAFWRQDRRHMGEPEVYFGMDYLVEADIEAALAMVRGVPQGQLAIRRQADRILEPFLRRVWVPASGGTAVDNATLLAWLDRPYEYQSTDTNINPGRFDRLVDLFGDRERFASAAHAANQTGQHELARVTDLTARCESAREQAQRSIAIARAQAEARQSAGRLTVDTESYLMDVRLADALMGGLSTPHIQLVSITCLVRGVAGAGRVS